MQIAAAIDLLKMGKNGERSAKDTIAGKSTPRFLLVIFLSAIKPILVIIYSQIIKSNKMKKIKTF